MRKALGSVAILLLAGCVDPSSQPVATAAPAVPAAAVAAPGTAPATQAGLIGTWRGTVVGLSTHNPARTLRITAMGADGRGIGSWSGEPVALQLSGDTLTFTSAANAQVSLRQTAPDRLEGTFNAVTSRQVRALVMTRQ